MADERYTFEQARIRLEEIAAQARKKDTTLEKSLDLLEEGARLALMCTELVDHTDFSDTVEVPTDVMPEDQATGQAPDGDADEQTEDTVEAAEDDSRAAIGQPEEVEGSGEREDEGYSGS